MERRDNMQLLILILKNVEIIEELLKTLAENNIRGCTILDGHGMGETLADMEDVPMFGALRMMMSSNGKRPSKVLMMAVKDHEIIQTTEVIKSVIGDLNRPNTGIMLSVPVYYCEGLVDESCN